MSAEPLGWLGIARLGLVQTALGAIVVLTTSTLNRVMVVELALPAVLPGALVALHYAVQILRPRLGHGSDVGGSRTRWIIGGMAVLAGGGVLASVATALMAWNTWVGVALAVFAFVAIGIGVGASGTTLLVLLAKRSAPSRRAAAATIVWIMMIAGIVVTASAAGHFLDPFSAQRLITVTATVSAIALVLTIAAVWGMDDRRAEVDPTPEGTGFRQALAQIWAEPQTRRFAIFIWLSMLAYSAQDLILEPFAGTVFGYTPGESTKLAGLQHAGVLIGMILVGTAVSGIGGRWLGSTTAWAIGGCFASAVALASLAVAGFVGPGWPLRTSVVALGIANGVFAVAAIGSMMGMVASGHRSREGVRMGLWGAAQAIAFGLGGFLGTVAADTARLIFGSPAIAYASVFAGEALLFVVSAVLAARINRPSRAVSETPGKIGQGVLAEVR